MPPYEEYIEMIKPLWDSHRLTNMGKYHVQLEQELKAFLDVPEVSLMVNGHMALEMTIQAMSFPPGAEVITTPFTFISTTHAILRNQLKPIFCDIKESDCTIDETKIESLITERTVAIVPVHVYGNICNVEAIGRIAQKYNLKIIYDAAHAFGETYKGIGIGNFGDASVFSFHASKVFHTIEGGAVCFKERKLFEDLYNLKNFGIRGEELVVSVGANAKMNEFSAVMGLCNLKYFQEEVTKRKKLAKVYLDFFAKQEGITVKNFSCSDVVYNYGYLPVVVEDMFGRGRDELYNHLKMNRIYARKYFYPLTSEQACFKNKYKRMKLPVAQYISSHILALPLHGELAKENLERIICTMKLET